MQFNREPAAWVGTIGAVLTVLAGFSMPGLNAGQATAITAFLTACVIAAFTRPVAVPLFTGALLAGVALLFEYGIDLSEAQVSSLTGLVVAAAALFGVRSQVTPKADPRPTSVV
jgi:hypothetical protein